MSLDAALDEKKAAVITAATQMVYDGMSDAAWHKLKRAVLALEDQQRVKAP
jgi:hypothetical protein